MNSAIRERIVKVLNVKGSRHQIEKINKLEKYDLKKNVLKFERM